MGNCDWGEIIFLENPTQLESDKVEGYLAHKWDLASALPSTHPYKIAHQLRIKLDLKNCIIIYEIRF